ncbi:MAG: amidase family protein [Anaerolineae bacterium]|nr:amidase family protein [Anaerolineae bacterium]MDQ7035965.1 amidase family protein [Anaerolineae bacterium]
MTFAEYTQYDGLGLAELVKKGEVSALELVETAIERIETHNPKINAVIHKMYDVAREAAQGDLPDGAFKGVPFLLKDLLGNYAGEPIASGSRFMKDYRPTVHSELVKRYLATGVVVVGKTNTPELGLVPFTEPEAFGATRNPWDTNHSPGGSSGGSGAAVAAGFVPLASGGDGGGSIRIPSSACALFGMKPTRARTPSGPSPDDNWAGLTVQHVLTRSVRDSAAMLDATMGADIGAPYYAPPPQRPYLEDVRTPPDKLKIAFTSLPFMGKTVDSDCKKALTTAVALLRELGHEVVEAAPQIDGKALSIAMLTMLAGKTSANIDEMAALVGRKPKRNQFEVMTWALYVYGKSISANQYAKAITILNAAGRTIAPFFETYDVLLTPTLATPPAVIGSLQPTDAEKRQLELLGRLRAGWAMKAAKMIEQFAETSFEYIPYLPVFNITGQPAMSVPLHWNDVGLPIGVQFVGRYADEATLFRLAGQLEQAKPWFDHRPSGYCI